MFKSLSFLIRYFLFWMLFFFLNRLVFVIWYAQKVFDTGFISVLKSFFYGAHMDASMAGYICLIPFLLFFISWFSPSFTFPKRIIQYYTFTLIILTAIFTLSDINIVREWGTKFNYRAIEFFLDSTGDAIASTSSSPILISFFYLMFIIITGLLLYQQLVYKWSIIAHKSKLYFKIPSTILVLGLTFLAIRGGWGVAPMNTSKVYFSDQEIMNYAAINTNWFLMSNIIDNQKSKGNPYLYFKEDKAERITDSLFIDSPKDFPKVVNNQRPNIVLIIMESFTADVVAELDGESGVTPNFSQLIKEGLLFNHIYSASDRTDKGLVGILSGFPSQAIRSIIKENDKQERLPSISQELFKNKYQTSFFYGGDTGFSNFKSYLLSHQYQKIIDIKSFKKEEIGSEWGVYDDVTFQKQLQYLNQQKQPFFSTLLTLSNHEPFDLPKKGKFGSNTVENKFRSTSFYTDEALADYVKEAKKQPWYANTLFIIIADHGHRLPMSINEINNPERYHIPLLFFGGALKEEFKGRKIEKYGSQVDVASTLLQQINIPDTAFHFSKNLLNPANKGFAFYSWDNGFGYIDKDKSVSFDPIGNTTSFSVPENLEVGKKKKALTYAKAMMQKVYSDFLNY